MKLLTFDYFRGKKRIRGSKKMASNNIFHFWVRVLGKKSGKIVKKIIENLENWGKIEMRKKRKKSWGKFQQQNCQETNLNLVIIRSVWIIGWALSDQAATYACLILLNKMMLNSLKQLNQKACHHKLWENIHSFESIAKKV